MKSKQKGRANNTPDPYVVCPHEAEKTKYESFRNPPFLIAKQFSKRSIMNVGIYVPKPDPRQ
jgi:hypothetical protein